MVVTSLAVREGLKLSLLGGVGVEVGLLSIMGMSLLRWCDVGHALYDCEWEVRGYWDSEKRAFRSVSYSRDWINRSVMNANSNNGRDIGNDLQRREFETLITFLHVPFSYCGLESYHLFIAE